MDYTITEFTPWSGLVGGALIGLSSGLMLWLTGRIAGISGIAAGVLTLRIAEVGWRALFIVGLILGALTVRWLSGTTLVVEPQVPMLAMGVGGFLVGFGTRMSGGCTSGHGICGLSRFSIRSLAAVLTFFVTAMLTVYVVRHALG